MADTDPVNSLKPPSGGGETSGSASTTSGPSYASVAGSPASHTTVRQRGASSPLGLSDIALPSASPHRLGIGRPFRAPVTPPGMHGRAGSISSIDESDDETQHATPRTGGYFPRHVSVADNGSGGLGPGGPGPTSGIHSPAPTLPGLTPSATFGRTSRPRIKEGEGSRSAPGAPGAPGATVSRSASRARLAPLVPAHTGLEDDEVQLIDRGEDLIRRRIKERKRAKRERERQRLAAEAEAAEDDDDEYCGGDSAPTSAQAEGFPLALGNAGSGAGYPRSPSRRAHPASVRARAPSAASRQGYASDVDRDRTDRSERQYEQRERDHSRDHRDHRPESLLTVPGEEAEEDLSVDEDEEEPEELSNEDDDESGSNEEPVTLRDRQDAINIEHPFGLPIWKPALYRKSRSVTRNAEDALHSKPSAAAERHLLPGNILWVLVFGWWLALSCASVALVVSGVEVLAGGRGGYGRTLRGLAWYIGWPFGKYVEGEGAPASEAGDEESSGEGEGYGEGYGAALTESSSSTHTVRAPSPISPVTPSPTSHPFAGPGRGVSFAPGVKPPDETAPLLPQRKRLNRRARQLGRLAYWPGFFLIVAPVMLVVCVICWFLVITIPMAKLTWELLELLYYRPLEINFRSAPSGDDANATDARLHPGQVAPTAGPTSTVLLCTYRAVGLQYVKYTVGGVNIMFINLLPLVFFTIFDGIVLLPMVEKAHREGRPVSPILNVLASQALIFVLGLASVIPLSYFLGMAVASISAQSSIGMGAVINATFGSIIEIVLYGIALTQGKGRLVEGSIVGSILAGVLLMPGASMCSGALKRKEQKFNAKSAGVTSTMLIMAIIGTLTPTMFYQVYGSFELHCEGCPSSPISEPDQTWKCKRCYYEYPEPTTDPFYQHQVKALMYACAVILVLSYLIGLWFSLRTHASQIWQNPQRVMAKEEVAPRPARITPAVVMNPTLPVSQMASHGPSHAPSHVTPQAHSPHRRSRTTPPDSPAFHRRDIEAQHPHQQPQPQGQGNHHQHHATHQIQNENENVNANANLNPNTGYTPLLQSLKHGGNLDSISPLPAQMTHEDFRRAVNTLATAISKRDNKEKDDDDDGAGGHEAPSWTRGVSAAVLLGCTLLYAIIAEVLVDVVDVVLAGSGVDEKFLGLTLFALVPNTTEFMNAMSFALQGNIALSMEIGSAYALQVCLLQIPAMVAFSAFTNPAKFGDQIDTFTLIFPRWDVIAIILAIFLLTYTYIEARSNYHRGSILVLAYCVLVMGFYYAPPPSVDNEVGGPIILAAQQAAQGAAGWSRSMVSGASLALTKLWA